MRFIFSGDMFFLVKVKKLTCKNNFCSELRAMPHNHVIINNYAGYISRMKTSAGILLYRFREKKLELFLVHPGGPFWKNKDAGAWSIPKGEFSEEEDPLTIAKKEFREETGHEIKGKMLPLEPIKQKGGKMVWAWAVEGNIDAGRIESNEFELEWPPRSGKKIKIPEVDKSGWFPVTEARVKINVAQQGFIDQLAIILKKNKAS